MLRNAPKGQLECFRVKLTDPIATLTLENEAMTSALAGELSKLALRVIDDHGSGVLALWGDLGAGKTSFARGFISAAMGYAEEVPSPTFTLLQSYDTPSGLIHHFDLYRLNVPDDALELGIEDAFSDGLCLIEWPDRLGPWLPRRRLDVRLDHTADPTQRVVSLSSTDPVWQKYLMGHTFLNEQET